MDLSKMMCAYVFITLRLVILTANTVTLQVALNPGQFLVWKMSKTTKISSKPSSGAKQTRNDLRIRLPSTLK